MNKKNIHLHTQIEDIISFTFQTRLFKQKFSQYGIKFFTHYFRFLYKYIFAKLNLLTTQKIENKFDITLLPDTDSDNFKH